MVEIFDNIRKIYRFSAPCEALADHIEFFSESCTAATREYIGNERFTVKMFASYTPTCWINLGAPYGLTIGNRQYRIAASNDILVVRDGLTERINLPADHIFTVKFFPGGLEAILGLDQSRMIDRVVPLQQVLPAALINQVKQLPGFEARMQLLQDFFLYQLHKHKTTDHYIQFVKDTIACYEAGNMQYNVNELSARAFTSSKTINRYFHRVVGVSPKNYFSIVRARTALTAWVSNKRTFVPGDFGYYDMSHFYREMARFTGKGLPPQDV
jgi:AraC-like DNA-binding protein